MGDDEWELGEAEGAGDDSSGPDPADDGVSADAGAGDDPTRDPFSLGDYVDPSVLMDDPLQAGFQSDSPDDQTALAEARLYADSEYF